MLELRILCPVTKEANNVEKSLEKHYSQSYLRTTNFKLELVILPCNQGG